MPLSAKYDKRAERRVFIATDSQNNQATVSRTFQVFGPLYLPAIIR